MYGCQEAGAGCNSPFYRFGVFCGAQLVADDVLRIHTAQRHVDSFGLVAAGIYITGQLSIIRQAIAFSGHQFAALVHNTDNMIFLTEELHHGAQKGGLSASGRT